MLDKLQFKTRRIMNEFSTGIDPRLQAFLLWLTFWIDHNLNKGLTITCLNRTVEENKQVNGSKYSAHLVGRAADLRTWFFTKDDIAKIIEAVNEYWGDFIYVLYHDAGSGNHLHVNISYKYHKKDYAKHNLTGE